MVEVINSTAANVVRRDKRVINMSRFKGSKVGSHEETENSGKTTEAEDCDCVVLIEVSTEPEAMRMVTTVGMVG